MVGDLNALRFALLLGPVAAASASVLGRGARGLDAARPFAMWGAAAFGVTGVLLVATLLGGDLTLAYLLLGSAAFGGAMLCGVAALVIVGRERRRRRRARPWPDIEDL